MFTSRSTQKEATKWSKMRQNARKLDPLADEVGEGCERRNSGEPCRMDE